MDGIKELSGHHIDWHSARKDIKNYASVMEISSSERDCIDNYLQHVESFMDQRDTIEEKISIRKGRLLRKQDVSLLDAEIGTLFVNLGESKQAIDYLVSETGDQLKDEMLISNLISAQVIVSLTYDTLFSTWKEKPYEEKGVRILDLAQEYLKKRLAKSNPGYQ